MPNFDFNFLAGSPTMGNSEAEFKYMLKALEAMEGITDTTQLESIGALQPQSLERVINNPTLRDKHFVLWNLLKPFMSKAESTVEEYAQKKSLGRATGMVGQMEMPSDSDPDFERKHAFIKYIRQIYKVSDVAQQVNTLTPALSEGKDAALKRLMKTFIFSMYRGDELLIPEAVTGFERTILDLGSSDHILDVRGNVPTQQQFADLTGVIDDNLGDTDNLTLLTSGGGINQIGRIINEAVSQSSHQRWSYGVGPNGETILGAKVGKISTQFGDINLQKDMFLSNLYENNNPLTLRSDSRAPLPPTVSAPVAEAGPYDDSKWSVSDTRPSGGAYTYRVAAGNKWGVSSATAVTASATPASGGRIAISITPTIGDPNPATYFIVYGEPLEGEGAKDTTKNYIGIGEIKAAADGVSAVIFYDYNEVIPGTTTAFLMDLSISGEGASFGIKALGAGIWSFPLAKIGPYDHGLFNLAFAPLYKQPRRYTMIRNMPVGRQRNTTNPNLFL